MIIVYIIGAILILGIISVIVEKIKDNWKTILLIFALIVAFFTIGPATLVFVILWILYVLIKNAIQKTNIDKLNEFLEKNCKNKGLVSAEDYKSIAPEFCDKKYYQTTFECLVACFVKKCEEEYFVNDTDWARPLDNLIKKNGMADMYELCNVSVPEFSLTHQTSEEILISKYMNDMSSGDKSKYMKITLQEEAVKEEMKGDSKYKYSACFLAAYKLRDGSKLEKSVNFESEELSLDDL